MFHRNAVLAICVGVCAVAVVMGLFIANLSSASRPINVTQKAPSTESPAPAATTAALAAAPTAVALATNAPAATQAPTSAPPAPTDAPTAVPTSAPPAPTEAPTAAPTSVPPTAVAVAAEFVEHTVQRGDELLQLAKRYNVSSREILDNNQIANPDSLVVGQVLRIPKK